jgi:hypothetical protein
VIDAEWSKKCSVVLQNEVLPRAKKLGLSLDEFADASALSVLARLEYEGIITRRTLREILDERVRILRDETTRI